MEDGNTGPKSTIHLVYFRDDPSLNLGDIAVELKYFYNLIGIDDIIVKKYYQQNPIVKLKVDDLAPKDAVSLIGYNPCTIIEFAKKNYSCILHRDFIELNNDGTIRTKQDLIDNHELLERGDSKGGKISIIRTYTINEDVVGWFKCKNKNHLIGFLIFHATGHNAGVIHGPACWDPPVGYGSEIDGSGYMWSGPYIIWRLGQKLESDLCGPNPEVPDGSLEQIIELTSDKVLEKIKAKYD